MSFKKLRTYLGLGRDTLVFDKNELLWTDTRLKRRFKEACPAVNIWRSLRVRRGCVENEEVLDIIFCESQLRLSLTILQVLYDGTIPNPERSSRYGLPTELVARLMREYIYRCWVSTHLIFK
jgi:hypothetical protein